ncbi:hypothetical protein [uncultured Clostridium sp.]|uniref:hypothetical protein n=1 Tax=uncultured Clostridium sp. TaxID=59620 RepID=UPI0025849844|nr:hypothetical protein [uncultured Clostridium sp.]
MIVAINYADDNFRKEQKYNTKTAYKKGKVDKVIEYTPEDIDDSFKKKYNNILKYKRGNGLWLWKPYFIVKTLKELEYGDYLFYCDSGAFYINDVRYLIKSMNEQCQSIMGYDLPLVSRQWTKRETFFYMSCLNNKDIEKNQILATYILLKKTKESVEFFDEFLEECCIEENISYEKLTNIREFNDFISHREDQSIFSILYNKYNFVSFRDPSQFGLRPWEYRHSKEFKYIPKKHKNSNYPRVVLSYRREKLLKFKIKEFIKNILFNLRIYNEKLYNKKRGI